MSLKESLTNLLIRGKRTAKIGFLMYCKIVSLEMLSLSRLKHIFRLPLNIVSPGIVSPINHVPDHIVKPYYCIEAVKCSDRLSIKSEEDIETMRKTCRLAKRILSAAESFINVGVSTDELDKYLHDLIIKNSAYPSPLLYQGFPKSICTSVNHIACHGIPDDRKLQSGDIVTVDVTVFRDGFHGDCAATFLVGDVEKSARDLVLTTQNALHKAIAHCGPGKSLKVIARAVTREAESHGYSVVPSICGHGIGRDFHEYPEIMHSVYYLEDNNIAMLPGMTFTIEPVLNEGVGEMCILDDGWSVASPDYSLSAQFEHTILITDSGVEVLTA